MSHIITQSATVITLVAAYLYFLGYYSFITYLGGFGLNVESFDRSTFSHVTVGAMSLFVTPPILFGIVFYGCLLVFFRAVYKKKILGFYPYYFLFFALIGWGIYIGHTSGSLAAEYITNNSTVKISTNKKSDYKITGNIIHQDNSKIAIYTVEKEVLVIPLNKIEYYSVEIKGQEKPNKSSKKDALKRASS